MKGAIMFTKDTQNYGNNIRRIRSELGLTMQEFGQAVTGYERPEQIIYNLEHSHNPDLDVLVVLANRFGISLNRFLEPENITGYKFHNYDLHYFPKNLCNTMRDKSVTCSSLSIKTGISVNSIKSYRIGRRFPKIAQLKSLADALGVSPECLICNADYSAYTDFPPG